VSLALGLGVAVRRLSKAIRLPYTVGMLLLGGALGSGLARWTTPLVLFEGELPAISPDAILFVFLPALVFESAFALNVHTFRRNLLTVATLAVPAMVVSTLLTALVVSWLAGAAWGWSFGAALVFGALISATDPVAVVAVLRELGAPKRLSLLIEGESLLNDGTAIVAFHVVLGLLVAGHGFDPSGTALQFLKVVAGGVAVGTGLAWLATAVLGQTFNDPLAEITVTLVLAYAAMAIAEGLLHVSGVMAIVSAGLWMAGPGQTRISPEVRHFLHRFWEMLAFLANTLIFFLVGVIISTHLDGAGWEDLLLIVGVYGAVVAIRFAVTFATLPVLRLAREPVRTKEAAVMAWGGLRGAVSLALALVVAQEQGLDADLTMRMLRLTAGVVLLTLLVNGTTTGWLLRRLGFVTPSASEKLANTSMLATTLEKVDEHLERLAVDAELGALPWPEVRGRLAARASALRASMGPLRAAIGEGAERETELWQRALRVEHQAHWRSFSDGVLGRTALMLLTQEIDAQRDALRAGQTRAPDARAPQLLGLRSWIARRLRGLGVPFESAEMGRLTLVYDLGRAESTAAEKVIAALVAGADPDDPAVAKVVDVYRAWRRRAKQRIEGLRATFPQVVAAIEARLAERIALNAERERVERLVGRGALTAEAAQSIFDDIEARMKQLLSTPRQVALPETVDLCLGQPLLRDLDPSALAELAEKTIEQALAPGEQLFAQGDPGDAMYVIARGAIRLTRLAADGRDQEVDVLMTGEVLGEMALLGGRSRNATATALTGAVVGRVSRKAFAALLDRYPEVKRRVYAAFASHALDDAVRADPLLSSMDRELERRWLGTNEATEMHGQSLATPWALILRGHLTRGDERFEGPALVDTGEGNWTAEGLVVCLGEPPLDLTPSLHT